MTRRHLLVVFVAAIAVVAGACSKGPLKVRTIQVGRTLNSDNSVGTITTQFKPADTIYASVLTDDGGKGTITVRWTYAGRAVSEEDKAVSYNGDAATEFHIRNPSGFPAGDYKVEILVDGMSIAVREFKVVA